MNGDVSMLDVMRVPILRFDRRKEGIQRLVLKDKHVQLRYLQNVFCCRCFLKWRINQSAQIRELNFSRFLSYMTYAGFAEYMVKFLRILSQYLENSSEGRQSTTDQYMSGEQR